MIYEFHGPFSWSILRKRQFFDWKDTKTFGSNNYSNCPPELAEFNESAHQHSASGMTWKKTSTSIIPKHTIFISSTLSYSQDLYNLWYVPRVLKALNKPAVPSHLGPITSAHQGPVFWEKNPRPILFSASFGVSADCQPLWLGVLHPRLRPPLHLPIQTVALVFFFGSRRFSPNWV